MTEKGMRLNFLFGGIVIILAIIGIIMTLLYVKRIPATQAKTEVEQFIPSEIEIVEVVSSCKGLCNDRDIIIYRLTYKTTGQIRFLAASFSGGVTVVP